MQKPYKKQPQYKCVCISLGVRTPKKPNSAFRRIAKVRALNINRTIIAYIPGEGVAVRPYNSVLIRHGRVQDLPGVKFKIIRGVLDAAPASTRKTSRSKYGTKKNN